jgi:hypothetical protein
MMPSWQRFLPCFSRRPASNVAATSCPRRVRCPQHGIARAAGLALVLDRHRRMGESSASGVPWGDGLGQGDLGRLEDGLVSGLPRAGTISSILATTCSVAVRGL